MEKAPSLNVLGGTLAPCSTDPVTGFFRDGACNTCAEDHGSHTVCAVMTEEFLPIRNMSATTCRPHARSMALPV